MSISEEYILVGFACGVIVGAYLEEKTSRRLKRHGHE